jgi:hypothetical protein
MDNDAYPWNARNILASNINGVSGTVTVTNRRHTSPNRCACCPPEPRWCAKCGGWPTGSASPQWRYVHGPEPPRPQRADLDAIRDATSSIANGIPSSRRQISTTAAASSSLPPARERRYWPHLMHQRRLIYKL